MKLIACHTFLKSNLKGVAKTWLIMKMITIFMTAVCLNASAKGYSQKVTLSKKDVQLERVFKEIRKQTGYTFVYTQSLLRKAKKITISVSNASLEQVLKECFKDQALTFSILNKLIIIKERGEETKKGEIFYSPPPTPALNITGKVTNDKGQPLVGASIKVKGTTIGTATDNAGKFTLQVSDNARILIISYVGFETKEVFVKNQSNIDIILTEWSASLNDVVVIGYGTQSKRDISSAISSVKGKEIQNLPVASPIALLQGRTAGVQIVQNSGAPGPTNFTVRVRGITSINAGNDPLYIVDGMPIEGSSSDINANDIESMEILKDASATAIYGSRGANGVILITTKRGKSGRTTINFNTYTSLQQIDRSRLPKVMNSGDFIELIQEQRANGTGFNSLYAFVLPDSVSYNTNWVDEIEQNGLMDNYEISASGGENKLKFYLSGGLLQQKGTIVSTDYKRYSAKLNLDYEASAKFKLGTNITLSNSNRKEIPQEFGVIQSALFKAPIFPVYNADGSYFINDISNTLNPVAVADLEKYVTKTFRIIANTFGEYSILSSLKFRTTWGIDFSTNKFDGFSPSTARRNQITSGTSSYRGGNNWVNENTLTFSKRYNNHRINALLGYSQLENRYENINASARDYATNNIQTLNAAATPLAASSSKTANGLSSFFGRAGYAYNDKYMVEASLRRDGSSKFGKENRFALFPAASIAWRVTQENFFKSLSSIVNDLKFRASFGKTGNQGGIGDYTSQGGYSAGAGYLGQSGVYPSSIPNDNLKWETTDQYNLGADVSILKSRVSLNADIYLKKTSNLLLNVLLPSSSGYGSALQNIGNTENRGLELNLNTVNISRKNFNWNSNFNITFNQNKVVKLYEGNEIINGRGFTGFGSVSSSSIIREGQPIGSFYGWQSLGVYANSTDNKNQVRNSNSTGYVFKGGDMIFADQNGDGIINDDDRVIIGNALPKFTGGFSNTLQYHDFEIYMLSQFTYGNDVYNGTRAINESMSLFQNGVNRLLNRWRKEGDITDIPRADHGDPGINKRPSYRWIEDGSYLRIKTLTLAYNLPVAFTQKIKLQNVRFYATAQNLVTFTNYTGIDPEANTFVGSVTDLGFDYATYPQYKSFLLGLNIGF